MKRSVKTMFITVLMLVMVLMLAACSNAKINFSQEQAQVGSVTLTAPEDNVGEVGIKPVFKWSAAENAKSYTLLIATDRDFEEIIFTRKDLAQNEFKMSSSLYNNTQYYWQVKAHGVGGNNTADSPVRSFTTKPEALQEEEQMLDDFEGYEYVALLQSEYYAPNGDVAKINLLENSADSDFSFSEFFEEGKLLEIEYDLHTHKFSNFTRNLHRSLLGTDGISLKVGNMGSSIKIVLDIFEKSGEGFRVYATVRGLVPYEMKIPYSAFQRHPDAGTHQDGILQVEDIAKFTLAIATDAETSKGKAYIDDIKAFVDKSVTEIVNTGYIAAPMEGNTPIIDLSQTTVNELKKTMDYHPDGGVSSFDITDTDPKQLKWVYGYDSAANKYWSMLRKTGYWNMENNHGISLRVRGNKSNNKLVIQLRDADGEMFYLKLTMNFDNEVELKIPFSTLVLKSVDDWGIEVDGLLHKQIINEISFTMESNVYDSSAKGGTIYLSDINVFSDPEVKGLTIDGTDIQTVDLFHDFEKDEQGQPFDISSIIITDAEVEVAEDTALFGENLLKVVTDSATATVDFNRSAQLSNASGITFWARSSHANITLDFVLQANNGNNYTQSFYLNNGLNFLVLRMSNFKYSGNSLPATAEIDNYFITLRHTAGTEIEVLLDNFYAYNTYNSTPLGRTVIDMIGKEIRSLPAEIDESNYESVKQKTSAITNLILQNSSNTDIAFSLIGLAPYITAFFDALNKIDDVEIGRKFEFGSVFKTNMVVQHGKDFAVHGFGRANEAVTVEFLGETISTTSDANGRFEVVFPASIMLPNTAGKILKATGEDGRVAEVYAVLIGDVYMVMGQQALLNNAPTDLTFTKSANVRIYTAESVLSGSPQSVTLNSGWNRTNTASYIYSNSILSFISNKIYEQNNGVPVGFIVVAYGTSTPLEAYASAQALPEMYIDMKEGYHAHSIYDTYINPLLGANLSGIIMMHGGGIVTDAQRYVDIMQSIQEDMQDKFGASQLPMYVLQSAVLSRFTQFSYNAAQSGLYGKDNFHIIPATDIEVLNGAGLSKIAVRLVDSILNDVTCPYATNIELVDNQYVITFSENVTYIGAFLDGFWLGNAEGEFDRNAVVTVSGNKVTVACSLADFEFNNVFYNLNGRGNLVSASNPLLPVGSFGTFAPYTIKSYNYIDEMKYENKADFDKTWQLRIAGVTQESMGTAVTIVNGEDKINFNYASKGMQILASPVNTERTARDVTDIRVWVKTAKNINFQCYLWFGAYPTDAKRYNTSLNVYYPDGGYVYIPLANVWGSVENLLDSLTHIGIGLDAWDTGTVQIGEITFIKAQLPSLFNPVKPAYGGVVVPNEPIEFLWEVSKRAETYELVIKDDQNNTILSTTTSNFYYTYQTGLAKGTYTYQITAINAYGEWQTGEIQFIVSEILKKDTLFFDFEMSEQEFKDTFKYRNALASPPWDDITAPIYASIEDVERQDGQTSKAVKIDTALTDEAYQDYYLAIRGAIDGNEAFGARYLKFWYKSNVELSSLNENARIEINLYIGSNHYYARIYDVPAGEGYIYVSLSSFSKGSSSNPDLAISMIDGMSIGVNVSAGAVVYFDDISLTYNKN